MYHQNQSGDTRITPCSDSLQENRVSVTVQSDYNNQSPKGCGSKSIRKRSRASKKTPTTLLNANTKNFRALVQQFTGCPSTPFAYKGPVNLSFGGGSNCYQDDHNQSDNINQFYGQNNNNNRLFYDQEQQVEVVYNQEESDGKNGLMCFDGYENGVLGSSMEGGYVESVVSDGFDFDDISLHGITAGSGFY